MNNRKIAGIVALAVVVAMVGLAIAAGRDTGPGAPATLPVLGAGGAATQAARATPDMRLVRPVRYEAKGPLPTLDSEADAYRLAAPTGAPVGIEALARTLGIDGSVTRTDHGWSVADATAELDVQRVAGLPWSRGQVSPDCCTEGTGKGVSGSAVTSSSGSAGSGTIVCGSPCPPDAECLVPDCGPVEQPQRPADLPTRSEAERIGRALLRSVGVDIDHATIRVEDGFSVWSISADPEVDGHPVVGMTTSIAVGPKGAVTYANGWLGEPTKADRYPLIGTSAALKQLNENQVRMLGGPQPMIARAPDAGCAADSPCTNMPVRPECGPAADCIVDPPPTEPTVVHLTGARLGLELFSTFRPGEAAYLVPAYLFMTEDGNELPVIAVDEKYLAPAPQPEPDDGGSRGKGEEPGQPPPPAVEPGRPTETKPAPPENSAP